MPIRAQRRLEAQVEIRRVDADEEVGRLVQERRRACGGSRGSRGSA
jgi:hypothetical protein